MTVYTAPPTQNGLVLHAGDFLFVKTGGLAVRTTLDNGSTETVKSGGRSSDTTINSGGTETVLKGGKADTTIINQGGLEIDFGNAVDTVLNDGTLRVQLGGFATNVVFNGSHSTLELSAPAELRGKITFFSVGDVIDFLNTQVTGVEESGNKLTVTYNNHSATYSLVSQQPNTQFQLQSDGHGGTELILVPAASSQSDLSLLGQYSAANPSLTSPSSGDVSIPTSEQVLGPSLLPTLAAHV